MIQLQPKFVYEGEYVSSTNKGKFAHSGYGINVKIWRHTSLENKHLYTHDNYLNRAYKQSSGSFLNSKLVTIRWSELRGVVVEITDKNRHIDSSTLKTNRILTSINWVLKES